MFLTANAANLFAVSLIRDTTGTRIGWTDWAVGFLPVGLVLFLALPALAYVIYPPSLKASAEVPEWARRELDGLGTITRGELIMALVVLLALGLWIFAGAWLHPTTVAFIALSLMFLSGALRWYEALAYKDAWNVLGWFGTLVTLADGLNRVGFVPWFADRAVAALSGMSIALMLPLFVALFFIAHYMFASLTAHATALLPAFLAAGAALPGMRLQPLALALCYTVGLMGVLTPYATGPAPIYFGSGYISRKEFWTLGSVFGLFYLLVLLGLGLPYLLATYR
jgi:L-tartrate/succinate antiporter